MTNRTTTAKTSLHPFLAVTTVAPMDAADFYTGIVAQGYALLKSESFSADRYADFRLGGAGTGAGVR